MSDDDAIVTEYEQLVTELNGALDGIIARIPRFAIWHSSATPYLRTHLSIPPRFISSCIAVTENHPSLAEVGGFHVEDAREAAQFGYAFRPFLYRVSAFQRNLGYTIGSRLADAAAGGLRVYAIAKRIAGPSGLAGAVLNMEEALGRAARRRPSMP